MHNVHYIVYSVIQWASQVTMDLCPSHYNETQKCLEASIPQQKNTLGLAQEIFSLPVQAWKKLQCWLQMPWGFNSTTKTHIGFGTRNIPLTGASLRETSMMIPDPNTSYNLDAVKLQVALLMHNAHIS